MYQKAILKLINHMSKVSKLFLKAKSNLRQKQSKYDEAGFKEKNNVFELLLLLKNVLMHFCD